MSLIRTILLILVCFTLTANFARPSPLPASVNQEIATTEIEERRVSVQPEYDDLCPCPKEFEKLDCDSGLCNAVFSKSLSIKQRDISSLAYSERTVRLNGPLGFTDDEPPRT